MCLFACVRVCVSVCARVCVCPSKFGAMLCDLVFSFFPSVFRLFTRLLVRLFFSTNKTGEPDKSIPMRGQWQLVRDPKRTDDEGFEYAFKWGMR